MSKVLLTAANGAYTKLLALALPTFEAYAERHGYEIVVVEPGPLPDRSPHWNKVQLLQSALESYQSALWLDCDVIICRFDIDIFDEMCSEDFQAFVLEYDKRGIHPNSGVWAMRSGDLAQQFLAEVWDIGQLPNVNWFDQAAVCKALGWSYPPAYTKPLFPSQYLPYTGWFDPRWNSLYKHDAEGYRHAHFFHYVGAHNSYREGLMRAHIAELQLPGYQDAAAPFAPKHAPIYTHATALPEYASLVNQIQLKPS